MLSKPTRERIKALKENYLLLKPGKEPLLLLIEEAELPEAVYNSNAIENSTLTLRETERVLFEEEVGRSVSTREVYEAKNLARVTERLRETSPTDDLTKDEILELHLMLMGGINDRIAGRLRGPGERVRVGMHVAPAAEQIERMLENALAEYVNDHESHDLSRVARFHLEFEYIHPFNDGNGRIGRVLINRELRRLGFPPIIIRDKEKKVYYRAFGEYERSKNTKPMEKILALSVMESLHKRIAYIAGGELIPLAQYAKERGLSVHALLNQARRQTIPAFREQGAWKISKNA